MGRQEGKTVDEHLGAAARIAALEARIEELERERRDPRGWEQRLVALLEATTDLVGAAEPDGRLAYLNRAGRLLLGLAPDESLEGFRIDDLRPAWAVRKVHEEGLPAALRHGNWQGETAVLTRTGEEIPVSQVIVVHRHPDGAVAYLSTIMRDIRERKRIEEELRRATEMFQLVLDNIPQHVFWKDRDSVYLGCNRNLAKVAGVPSVEAIVGKTDYELAWKREEADFFRQVDRRVMERDSGELHIIEPQLQADGRQAWLVTNKIPLHDAAGAVVGILGTFEDITDRKLAEDALIQSEENLRITLESIGDGVIAADAAGRVLRMNPVAEQLTGWNRGDALGRLLGEVYCVEREEEDGVESLPLSWLLDSSNEDRRMDATLRSRTGRCWKIAENAAPMRAADGTAVGVVLVFRDVTEQRRLEEQVRQSQKMDSIGQLAGGIAHDFNNMLTAIMGSAEILTRGLRDRPALVEVADTILEAADNAAQLTQKLLDFSRKGRQVREPVDVHEVVSSAIALLMRTVNRNILIREQLTARMRCVYGDPAQLQNAILNLGLNARDAMVDGGTLTISSCNLDLDAAYCETSGAALAPGPYIEVEVRDSGGGMTAETVERAFEPFFTTKEVGHGTGLGLSSAYSAVRDHGGEIALRSELGQGTIACLYLPVSAAAVPTKVSQLAPPRGRGRILLADDEPMVRRVACRLLRQLGYEVIEADDGAAALRVFTSEHQRIDLVILDMVMPSMSGREALAAMKRIAPDVRALYSSGFTRQGSVDYLADGVKGFVKKPYRVSELAQQVARALR